MSLMKRHLAGGMSDTPDSDADDAENPFSVDYHKHADPGFSSTALDATSSFSDSITGSFQVSELPIGEDGFADSLAEEGFGEASGRMRDSDVDDSFSLARHKSSKEEIRRLAAAIPVPSAAGKKQVGMLLLLLLLLFFLLLVAVAVAVAVVAVVVAYLLAACCLLLL
jgi:hypothetical protein